MRFSQNFPAIFDKICNSFFVEKQHILEYNKEKKFLGCATPYYFEPTFTFMGFLYC